MRSNGIDFAITNVHTYGLMRMSMSVRQYCVGAEVLAEGGADFRVWAPKCARVAVVLDGVAARAYPLTPEADGYFRGVVADARAGTRYRFRLDDDPKLYPDPASRFQPDGPEGPSQVVEPRAFRWTDADWQGVAPERRVVYEMHIGTFTQEGTWRAAERELRGLADVGVTILEVMPVADFPGRFGWGYDGVNLFAPTRLYGDPDDFRHFVDAAHALGMGVILDVVYNHFGPDGNYLTRFADAYVTTRYDNEWGDALNFDGPDAGPVREYFLANAAYWIDEFHLDGMRLDATQQIFDQSAPHILAELAERVRAAGGRRRTFVVAENEREEANLVRTTERGGYGLDAMWNDDFHHSAVVALTGRIDAYYQDHLGQPQEFISAAKWGFLFQGQWYSWQKARRGHASLDLAPSNFVTFLENHDQVANSACGARLRLQTSPGRWRAMTALLLLGPATPMLFQGQEFGSTRPFFFFADHKPELAKKVTQGRRQFMSQFANMIASGLLDRIPEPSDGATFARCKLERGEKELHPEFVALHTDLLRREDPAFRAPARRGVDGAVLGPAAFVLRFFVDGGDDRLLLVNLGRVLKLREAPEPLLAPPEKKAWRVIWSSEDGRYGGLGHAPPEEDGVWIIPGEAAVVLAPVSPQMEQ
jgi:maltooligosyltrehalose trehalohydrolase